MNKLITACIFTLLVYGAGSQELEKTLARYSDQFQHEKAWLHYDKSSYHAGETIWFKAYLMEDLYPAGASKTLYVDWIAGNGTVLSHTVSPVVEGTTNGQFGIPEDYEGDFIHVRAYTKWMLNFDTAFLYNKAIRILSKKQSSGKAPARTATLQFFPEGGDAIEGIANTIAFKVIDQYGTPVQTRGVIQDDKGSTIDSFSTVHDGMGSFIFTPRPGVNYSARWKDINGSMKNTVLPQAKTAGVGIQVLNQNSRIQININSGQIDEQLKQLHLVGTMNQRMAFKTDITINQGESIKRVIPTENLPSGIMTITVFDSRWNAIAERIAFVNNNEYRFQPQMEVKHWGTGKRKRNEVEITLPPGLEDASLSISVTDAAIETDSSQHIISHFLLSSEIRGKVHNAAYYFSSDKNATEHLDLVMLTHGWRRFKWEEVVKGEVPKISYPKDTSYLTLSGQLFGVAKSQLSGTDHIVLMVKEDSATRMIIMPINTDGTFNDPDVVLFDTVQFYYSLKSKFFKSAEARFMTDRLPAPNYSVFSKGLAGYHRVFDTTGSFRHRLLASESIRFQEALRGKMMENVTVQANRKTPVQELDEKYPTGFFKGGDGYQFDLINDPLSSGYMSIFNYLQGKVAGLQIMGEPPTLSWRGGAPGLFLDEIPTDISMISTIPVSDIAYVKVFRPPFMGGSNGSNGAIAIYTRRGNDAQHSGAKGLTTTKVMGYTPIREFYSPNYDRFDPRHEQPDVRTTLYWNPLLGTTKTNNTIRIVFYNNDVSTAFRVIIEGMSRDGLLTHFEQVME